MTLQELIQELSANLELMAEGGSGMPRELRSECSKYGIEDELLARCVGWLELYSRANPTEDEADKLKDELMDEQQALLTSIIAKLTIKSIGERIKSAREQKGMSRYQLCKDTGVRMRTLIDTEEGRKCPTLNTLVKIGAWVGISFA